MYHLELVEGTGDGRTHWKIKAPLGGVEWDAEGTEIRLELHYDVPGGALTTGLGKVLVRIRHST